MVIRLLTGALGTEGEDFSKAEGELANVVDFWRGILSGWLLLGVLFECGVLRFSSECSLDERLHWNVMEIHGCC